MSDATPVPDTAAQASELVYDVHVCAERHLYDGPGPPTEPWTVHAGEFATTAWPATDGRFMLAAGTGLWIDYC